MTEEEEKVRGLIEALEEMVHNYRIRIEELEKENEGMTRLLKTYGLIENPDIPPIEVA